MHFFFFFYVRCVVVRIAVKHIWRDDDVSFPLKADEFRDSFFSAAGNGLTNIRENHTFVPRARYLRISTILTVSTRVELPTRRRRVFLISIVLQPAPVDRTCAPN